jgi:hypothetical protein
MPADFRDILGATGGAGDLAELLRSARDLCTAAGGPTTCAELLRSSKDLILAAGGSKKAWRPYIEHIST